MQPEVDLADLQRRIEARKAALGITDADADLFRNSGLRRTPEKRALLARISERCQQAGVTPLPANY